MCPDNSRVSAWWLCLLVTLACLRAQSLEEMPVDIVEAGTVAWFALHPSALCQYDVVTVAVGIGCPLVHDSNFTEAPLENATRFDATGLNSSALWLDVVDEASGLTTTAQLRAAVLVTNLTECAIQLVSTFRLSAPGMMVINLCKSTETAVVRAGGFA
jgi:hypothetical protein